MRPLTLLFCTCVLVACHAVPVTIRVELGDERRERWAYAAEHTYRVSNPFGSGSGWAFDTDTIMTNRHVVEGAGLLPLTVSQGTTEWLVMYIENIDGEDAALLHVIGPPLNVPPIRMGKPRMGEWVTMSGHPHGNTITVTEGAVCSRWFYMDWAVDGAVIPGMSGGPVFDMKGRLIGMNVATTGPPGRNLGIFIDIMDIMEDMP